MNRTTLNPRLRGALFAAATGLSLWLGLAIGSSPAECVHLAIVPLVAAHAILYRPRWLDRLRWTHVTYFCVLGMVTALYMSSVAGAHPALSARWREWLWAVVFLLGVHVIVAIMASMVRRGVAAVVGLLTGDKPGPAARAAGGVATIVILTALLVPYLTATFLTHWVKFSDATSPATRFGGEAERVSFRASDGVRLTGWFVPAAGGETDATVIIAPSHDPVRTATLCYAGMLREHFNVFVFDSRGFRDSGGHARSFGALESRDVLGAVRYLKAERPEAGAHVFGLGVGEGATAMARAAARDPRIEAVVMDTPPVGGPVMLTAATAGLPGPVGVWLRQATEWVASVELGTSVRGNVVADLARIAPRPVLVIRGDELISAGPNTAITESDGVTVWQVPDAPARELLLLTYDEYHSRVYTLFESIRRGWEPILPSTRG